MENVFRVFSHEVCECSEDFYDENCSYCINGIPRLANYVVTPASINVSDGWTTYMPTTFGGESLYLDYQVAFCSADDEIDNDYSSSTENIYGVRPVIELPANLTITIGENGEILLDN